MLRATLLHRRDYWLKEKRIESCMNFNVYYLNVLVQIKPMFHRSINPYSPFVIYLSNLKSVKIIDVIQLP